MHIGILYVQHCIIYIIRDRDKYRWYIWCLTYEISYDSELSGDSVAGLFFLNLVDRPVPLENLFTSSTLISPGARPMAFRLMSRMVEADDKWDSRFGTLFVAEHVSYRAR